jgi:hypothetical protein
VTHIEAVDELPADPEWEQKADDLRTIVEALDNGDWLQTATTEHADWLDEQRTREDARF